MKADRIVLGVALLLVGSVWVLVNAGVIPPRVAADLWRYWPLLIVLWGALILSGRGAGGLGCLVPLIIGLFILSFFSFAPFINFGPSGPVKTSNVGLLRVEGIQKLELSLIQHAGEFTLGEATMQDKLIQARFRTNAEPEVRNINAGGIAEVTIQDVEFPKHLGRQASSWQINVPGDLPADISLRTGATKAELDMRNLKVQNLELKAGAGDLTLHLGVYDGNITIESGAGSVTIYVPDNTGVRLRVSGGLVSVDAEDAKMTARGDRTYASRNIEDKDAIIDINITAAAGSVKLRPAKSRSI